MFDFFWGLALKSWMLYSDSGKHEMMQNAVNESFWDAHGVEIGPCSIFKKFVQNAHAQAACTCGGRARDPGRSPSDTRTSSLSSSDLRVTLVTLY